MGGPSMKTAISFLRDSARQCETGSHHSDRPLTMRHPSFPGRRRGDTILLAWKYARERGDRDVAAQLMLEYKKIVDVLPASLSADRRRNTGGMYAALKGLWA